MFPVTELCAPARLSLNAMTQTMMAVWQENRAQIESVPVAARRTAFATLARRFEGELLRTARRLCGPSHGGEDHARDLVQDTLVRAYEALLDGQYGGDPADDSPSETRRARAWLFRTLTNRFINDYRRRRRWEAGVTVDTVTAGGATAPTPELSAASLDTPGTALLAATLDERLERALLSLSENLRLCVVLVDIEGLEYAEAASALGVPVGTVRSRLSRARLQLQETLADFARDYRLYGKNGQNGLRGKGDSK